jgi:hypothetical protein
MESSGCQILDIILHHENLLHVFNTSSAHHFIHLEYQSVIFIQEKTTKICIKTISLPFLGAKTIYFPYFLIFFADGQVISIHFPSTVTVWICGLHDLRLREIGAVEAFELRQPQGEEGADCILRRRRRGT